MVYVIKKGLGAVGGAYIAQWSCNSIAIGWALQVRGWGGKMIDSYNKSFK